MGLSLEASEAYAFNTRPRYFDTLEVYDAADGEVLFPVFKRRVGLLYYFYRHVFKAARWIVRTGKALRLVERDAPEPQNPNPYEIEALWKDEAKAAAHCRKIVADSGGRAAAIYAPIAVDRAFPTNLSRVRGAVRPTARFRKREPGPKCLPLFVMLPESEVKALRTELDEWRTGKRERDENASLRRCLAAVVAADGRFHAIEQRLDDLERGRVAGDRDT